MIQDPDFLANVRTLIERVRDLHQPTEHRVVAYSRGNETEWHDVEDAAPEIRCSCTPQGMLPYPCPTVIALDTPTVL